MTGCCWKIGRGDQVQMWRDAWLPTQAGYKLWTTPNTLDEAVLVRDLMDDNGLCWNEQLLDQILLPFEAQQVKRIYLSPRQPPDQLVWMETKRGKGSAKRAYHFLMRKC